MDIKIKQCQIEDYKQIVELKNDGVVVILNNKDCINILERSVYANIACDEGSDRIIAVAAVQAYPNTEGIEDPFLWEKWLCCGRNKFNGFDTCFLSLFISESPNSSILSSLITNIYENIYSLQYILVPVGNSEDLLRQVFPNRLESFSMLFSNRNDFYPVLHIRYSRPEDNDDVIELFKDKKDVLQEKYGDYFIAELVEAQNNQTKCFSAIAEDKTVGFMYLNTDIDKKYIRNNFHIDHLIDFDENVSETASQGSNEVSSRKSTGSLSSFEIPSDECPDMATISLFVIMEKYSLRSFDFMWHVFNVYPTIDYCCISVPYDVPEFDLLGHFMRLIPKYPSSTPHELYICHRASIIQPRSLSVAPMAEEDLSDAERLVKDLRYENDLISDCHRYFTRHFDEQNQDFDVYGIKACDQLVGIISLVGDEDSEKIYSHYNLNKFIKFEYHQRSEHSILRHFALNPIFFRFRGAFMGVALRLSRKTTTRFSADRNIIKDVVSLNPLVLNMVVLPKIRQIIYPLRKLKGNAPSHRILEKANTPILLHFNLKLVHSKKRVINLRIVLVGASQVGLSFLQSAIFKHDLLFNNLILVSPRGIPEIDAASPASKMISSSIFHDQNATTSLKTHVGVVEGSLTAINRTDNEITVDSWGLLPYDYLFLCSGRQYSFDGTLVAEDAGKIASKIFTVNYVHDAQNLLNVAKNSKFGLAIYGSCLNAFSCVNSLVEAGIGGDRISLLLPVESQEENYIFNDPVVERAILEEMMLSKVKVYPKSRILNFSYKESEDVVQLAVSTNSGELLVEVGLVAWYGCKEVDRDVFKAIQDSCIVFDGGIVIDNNFCTNDPKIKSAGTVSIYKRSYHAGDQGHSIYQSREIGALLFHDMNCLLNSKRPNAHFQFELLHRTFDSPLIEHAYLPGYEYLSVKKAGKEIPYDLEDALIGGTSLVTNKTAIDKLSYFRLYLDENNFVQTITCLDSNGCRPWSNLACLWGKHHLLLNNLLGRYREGLIQDFFSYFEDTWSLLMYHFDFHNLLKVTSKCIVDAKTNRSVTVGELAKEYLASQYNLESAMTELTEYSSDGQVVERVLDYVIKYYSQLPFYAYPDIV